MNQSEEKPKRPRTVGGSIIRKKKIVQTRRGEKEIEELFARVRRNGREKKRKINSVSEAAQMFRTLADEFLEDERKAAEAKSADGKTFDDLVKYYEQKYVKEAVWRDNQVVEGLRQPLAIVRGELKVLTDYFGGELLSEIEYDDLAEFRSERLQTSIVVRRRKKVPLSEDEIAALRCADPKSRRTTKKIIVEEKRDRKIASVNRELSRLRRLFKIAVERGWLTVSPFQRGESLISLAAENERTRILTPKEETALIKACSEPQRAHLRSIVIFALDTAARRGERRKLRWRDVDFEKGVIYLEGKNTKTIKPRIVPMTKRLLEEMKILRFKSNGAANPDEKVFDVSEIKRSFATACRIAGIKDFRFHDLRHTATTKIQNAVKDSTRAMRITGHSQLKTFQRYVNVDVEIAQEVGALLDAAHEAQESRELSAAPSDAPNVVELRKFVESK